MFKSPLHGAVMAHVKAKIKTEEEKYQAKLEAAEVAHTAQIQDAHDMLKQQRAIALEESIQSVIKSLV